MLKCAVSFEAPIAIRYPRGEAYDGLKEFRNPIEYGKAEWIYEEGEIAILAVGSMVKTGLQVYEKLKEEGYKCSLCNARFVKPIDTAMVDKAIKHKVVVTLEENVLSGGFGEKVCDYMKDKTGTGKLIMVGIPDEYVEHGNVDQLRKEIHIDADSIINRIKEAL